MSSKGASRRPYTGRASRLPDREQPRQSRREPTVLTAHVHQLVHHRIAEARVLRATGCCDPTTEMSRVSDKVPHRTSGRRFGKPLWEYSSIEQFVRAMICVLESERVFLWIK